jgi:DNA-binding IclR family transcriptional regulator
MGAKVSLTVDKALRILELLGDGELRLTDLCSKLGEHKSTVQRLLSTLQARGFVRQNGDNNKIESTFPIRMYSRAGARAESYCTGVGKALVAFLSDYERQRYLQKVSFTRFTPNTITSAKGLREEIARIREQGYALDLQEHEEEVRCAAAPIFGLDGRVAESISVAAPAFRKSEDDILALAPAVMAAARQISDNLGSKREEGREEPA